MSYDPENNKRHIWSDPLLTLSKTQNLRRARREFFRWRHQPEHTISGQFDGSERADTACECFEVISRRKSLIFLRTPFVNSPLSCIRNIFAPFYIIRTQMAFIFDRKVSFASSCSLLTLRASSAAFRLDVKWETFLWIKYSNDDSRMKRTEKEKGNW